jgi:putative two-component system response regulator
MGAFVPIVLEQAQTYANNVLQQAKGDGKGRAVKKRILFVDDEPFILTSIRRSIMSNTSEWELSFAESGARAIELFSTETFDLVVTDAKMPNMTGNELLGILRERGYTNEIPTIMLTGYAEDDLRKSAIDNGVIEFLSKPIMPEELIQRLRNVLRLKSISDELKVKNEELKESSMQIIRRLGKAVEYRDNETGKHVIRVAHYSRIIAEAMRLDNDTVELIYLTAPMHDIGKIAIPDEILKKKEKLKPIEFEVIMRHPLIGGDVLKPLSPDELKYYYTHVSIGESILGETNTPILRMAGSIAATHHEKWDGAGYPHGLKGTAIPIEGRIVAIADIFDALSSKRYYKPAYPDEECVTILREMRGTHLDPDIVDCFDENKERILAIKEEMKDQDQ